MNKAMVAAIALTDIFLAAGTGEGAAGDVAQMWVLMGALFCVSTPVGAAAAARAELATPPEGGITPLAAEWIMAQWVSIALRAVLLAVGGFGFWLWRPDLLPYLATTFPACVVADIAIRWGFKPMKIARIGEGAAGLQVVSGVTLAVTNVLASWVLAHACDLGLLGIGLGTLIAEIVAGVLPVTVAYRAGALVRPSLARGLEIWKDCAKATRGGAISGARLIALLAMMGLLEGAAKDAYALITETAFSAAIVVAAVIRVTQRKARRGEESQREARWAEASSALHRPLQLAGVVACAGYILAVGAGPVAAAGVVLYAAGSLICDERQLAVQTMRCEEDHALVDAKVRATTIKVTVWVILACGGWVTTTSLIASELLGMAIFWLELRD